MKSIIQTGILLSALAGFAAHATTTATANFQVKLTITESCTISAGPPTTIDFGTMARTITPVTNNVSGQLSVNCSAGTDYTIGLSGGLHSVSAAAPNLGERRMKHSTIAAAPLVPYELFQDNVQTFWGNTAGTWLSRKGTGAAEVIPVFGGLTNVNFQAGVYDDTVTATITY